MSLGEIQASPARLKAADPAEAPVTYGPTAGGGSERRPRLIAIDLVRILAMTLVVSVHTTSLTNARNDLASHSLIVLLHVSREVFFLLSAFVLFYQYGHRQIDLKSFWRRRYWFIGVPYVAWSVIYLVANGAPYGSPGRLLGLFWHDLWTGSASYQLYFLLVSAQLYLVFPLVVKLVKATRGHHGRVLAASMLLQVAFSGIVQYRWPIHLTGVMAQPNALLPAYQLFVIAGALAADHWQELLALVVARRRQILIAAAVFEALDVSLYFVQVKVLGLAPAHAAAVFQPVNEISSTVVTVAFLALGQWFADTRRPGGRTEKAVLAGSDASFGIYLAHPLAISGLIWLAAEVHHPFPQFSGIEMMPLDMLVLMPLVMVAAWAFTRFFRCTQLSLVLTGRTRSSQSLAELPVLRSMAKARQSWAESE